MKIFRRYIIALLIMMTIVISSCDDSSNPLITDSNNNVPVDSAGLAKLHLTMGNPTSAVKNILNPTNYLMEKPEYVLSYNRDKGTANWVAWHLNSSWRGNVSRQDDFRYDSSLPSGWYQVQSTSYRGSGYDRGHICPSADRTSSVEVNSATFFMTNMIPQAPNNNQGPWADMENYLRSLIEAGKEIYIYSGGYGSSGTIDNGHINIPQRTWKVAVILDEGDNDLSRISNSTRIIAVDMPNDDALINRTDDWKSFRVTTDYVETQTGYDFLSNVSVSVQNVIEGVVDNQ